MEPLRSLATYGEDHLGRIHALWTLEGLGKVNVAVALQAMGDRHPRVRIAAAQVAEGLADAEGRALLIKRLVEMTEDHDAAVRVQVMLTLGAFNDDAGARGAMAKLLLDNRADKYLRGAAISGLAGHELGFLRRVLREESSSNESQGLKAIVGELAATIMRGRSAATIEGLLGVVALGWHAYGLWQQYGRFVPDQIRIDIAALVAILGLVGLAMSSGARRLTRLAAILLILSAAGSVIGLHVGTHYEAITPDALPASLLTCSVGVFLIQSAWGWLLLPVASRI
ncbi:MAG: HEAT repeat domain-containing protein [Proteobacteria bacterium]|nr:HEAT repeat domain-containing protein [Pseudomonadota bacterium]